MRISEVENPGYFDKVDFYEVKEQLMRIHNNETSASISGIYWYPEIVKYIMGEVRKR